MKSCLPFRDYKQKGLYLLFEDSAAVTLTDDEIRRISKKFWEDADRIPPEIRESADFKLCPICPEKGKEGMCYAVRPVLPFLEILDRYSSYDKVTAVYRGEDEHVLSVSDTRLADALRYISVLSLMYYCRAGRRYWKYYFGVNPLSGGRETRNRIYLNMYWLHKGNLDEITQVLSALLKMKF